MVSLKYEKVDERLGFLPHPVFTSWPRALSLSLVPVKSALPQTDQMLTGHEDSSNEQEII